MPSRRENRDGRPDVNAMGKPPSPPGDGQEFTGCLVSVNDGSSWPGPNHRR